jgi:hypothetical protein
MPETAFQKIYVILEKQEEGQVERFYRTLFGLFSHMNLTSNIYLITGNLPDSMPLVERILEGVNQFLKENLFARLYIHFVHPVPQGSEKEIRICYRYLKRETREFDQEGFIHQEVPRLMLLPVVIPDVQKELVSLKGLLDDLKASFLLPSLYLDRSTFFLARDEALLARTEKVYFGEGDSRELGEIAFNLCHQDILDDSCTMLTADSMSMTAPCPASLIVSTQDGKIYACMDALRKGRSLTDVPAEINEQYLMALFDKHGKSKKVCLACRERVIELSASMPLPKETTREVGALLF